VKKTIAAIILTALAASPALAKTPHHMHRAATDAYASSAGNPFQEEIYGNSPVAYAYGQVVGQDPDPNVRLEMERSSLRFSGN
jgi:hypothetical protein